MNPVKERKKLREKKLLKDDEIVKIREKSKLKKEIVEFCRDFDGTIVNFVAKSNSIYLYEFIK